MSEDRIVRQAHKEKAERLAELEDVIERHIGCLFDVGAALLEVRREKLYKLTHPTFEAWVKLRFNLSRRRAYELMTTVEVRATLKAHGAAALPTTRRETEELAKFSPDEQPVIWASAISLAGDEEPTGTHVRRAAREARRLDVVDRLRQTNAGNQSLGGLGPFNVILADNPWQYDSGTTDPTRQIENQYPTMPTPEIAALPVREIAADDAVLFMWAPPAMMIPDVATVLEGWGFTYKTHGVWDKVAIGGGYWLRIRHEDLVIAVRGNPPHPNPSDLYESIWTVPRSSTHSAKPESVHEMIEKYYPTLAKVELFARAPRGGWAVWGNEASGCKKPT
jgi:N6-adenosine-specific RNA methylase IME4